MSLTNFEMNLGFNGEPTTASVSFVYKKKLCGNPETTPDMGQLGQQINTGRQEIDNLIGDFVVVQTSTKKDAGFKRISYEMVDKEAKRLDSIAVLVRGVTAPSTSNSLEDYSRIFSASETDLNLGILKKGLTSVTQLKSRIFVIGRTFSSVSGSYADESGTRLYSEGKEVSETTTGGFGIGLKKILDFNRKNATIKYGYYLSDLKNLITMAGYTVKGYPTDKNFILMDFGGSLKEVISSVAGMYGLFWYVRGNKIEFFDNEDLLALNVKDFTKETDASILSASYSKDLSGRSSVGVIYGSSQPKQNTSSSGSSQGGGNRKRVKFFYFPIETAFGGQNTKLLLKNLMTFFLFSGDTAAFDKIILLLMAIKHKAVQGGDIDKLYGEGRPIGTKLKLAKVIKDLNLEETEAHPFKEQYEDLYSMQIGEKTARLPSDTSLYSATKAAAEAYGSLFISRPVSKYHKENYLIAANEGFSVHGPYQGDTSIKDVPELQGIHSIIKAFFDEGEKPITTLRQLYEKSKPAPEGAMSERKAGGAGKPVLSASESFHYIAIKDLLLDIGALHKDEKDKDPDQDIEKIKEDVVNATKDVSGKYFTYDNTSYVASGKTEFDYIKKMVLSSQQFVDSLKNMKKQVSMFASEIQEERPEGDENYEEEELDSEYVSFKIRDGSRDLSSVSVIRFEGTNDEANHIDSQFSRLFSPSFNPESSSVNYSGFIEVDMEDPALSSVSYSFSENGVDTSISYSNRDFAAEDQSVVMASFSANSSSKFSRGLKTAQKNFLGVH